MHDDQKSKSRPTPLVPDIPLEYWHSTEPTPAHPVVLGLFLIAGFVVGIGLLAGCGGTLDTVIFDAGRDAFGKGLLGRCIFGTLWLALGAGYVTALRGWIKAHRLLPWDKRRTTARFLTLGLLMGGVAGCNVIFVVAMISSL
jgi:hypothetical protein